MIKKVSFLFFLIIYSLQTFAQCAMCKSVVESNIEGGSDIGTGLNDGILFLMAMPYIAVFLFCISYYFQNKKTKALN